ncbi:MAG: ATP-binding protein [Nannocystaceae bacterium]|nr:ATP-binding protein [bacterium]
MSEQRTNDWERRALAAEKTSTMLKEKVISLYGGDGQSMISQQLERAKQREAENRRRREMMEIRQQELAKNAERLEGLVAERTRAIRTILDNVAFGFVLVGRDLQIAPGFTRSCSELFGSEVRAGMRLTELLKLDGRSLATVESLLDQVFEDILPEFCSLDQLPERYIVGGRVLKVEPSVVRDAEGEIETLLLSISDVTALEQAQREAARNHAVISILGKRAAFSRFVADTRMLLDQAAEEQDDAVKRRLLHTVKGNAASWGLSEVAVTVHHIEDLEDIGAEDIDRAHAEMERFLDETKDVIGVSYRSEGDDECAVTRSKVRELRLLADGIEDEAQSTRLRRWAATIAQCPASDLMGPLDTFVAGLGERLGKPVHLTLEGINTPVDPDTVGPVFRNLTHLIRNSVDHGLEEPGMRGDKPEEGQLRVSVTSSDAEYVVEVVDDGRGIDVERVVQKACAMGIVDEAEVESMSEQEKLALIFHDGLSSAEQTTEISGRGVGMAAIYRAVKAQRGRILIQSAQGQGTTIAAHVPKPVELQETG